MSVAVSFYSADLSSGWRVALADLESWQETNHSLAPIYSS